MTERDAPIVLYGWIVGEADEAEIGEVAVQASLQRVDPCPGVDTACAINADDGYSAAGPSVNRWISGASSRSSTNCISAHASAGV